MKKILLLLIISTLTYTKVLAQGDAAILLPVMIEQKIAEYAQLASMGEQLKNLMEQTAKIRKVYKTINDVVKITSEAVKLTDLVEQTALVYKEYYGGIEEMISSKFPLTEKEVLRYINLLDAAAFEYHATESNKTRGIGAIAGGKLKEFDQLLDLIKESGDLSGTNIKEMLKMSKSMRLEINQCLDATRSCRRYIRANIKKLEYENGIYDRNELKRTVTKRIKKYEKYKL